MDENIGVTEPLKMDSEANARLAHLTTSETTHTIHEGSMEDIQRSHFSVLTAIGINYSLIGTPLTIGTYLAFSSGVGGSPVYIFGYIVALIFQLLVCVSLAELAAALPHPSGQMYWTSVLGPKRWARSLSYWSGALMTAAWFFWTTGTFLLASQLLFAIVSLGDPNFTALTWQIYMGILSAAIFSLVMNTALFKTYPLLLKLVVVLINGGTIVVLVGLLVRTSPKQSARVVFLDFVNETGWSSDGFVFLLGLLPGITAINGFDSSTHLAHELPRPAVQIPQVMLGTAILAGLSGLPMTVVFMFCVKDPAALLAPIGGQPVVQLFHDSLDNLAFTIAIVTILVVIFFIGSSAMVTTTSRVVWSLAEQSALPDFGVLRKLSIDQKLPTNAIILASIAPCLLGLLELGSTTVLNAILGSAAICFFGSYSIAICCLLQTRSAIQQRKQYFSLGRLGPIINVLAVSWMVLMSVVLVFPLYVPVTADTMNYAAAVVAATVTIFAANWFFYARHHYIEPAESHVNHRQ